MDDVIMDFVTLPEPDDIDEDMHPSPVPKLHDSQRFVQPTHHLDLHQNWEDCGGARWHIVIAREAGAAESVPCMCRQEGSIPECSHKIEVPEPLLRYAAVLDLKRNEAGRRVSVGMDDDVAGRSVSKCNLCRLFERCMRSMRG